MHIVIFCDSMKSCVDVSNELFLRICDHVNCRTRHNRTVFDIDEKDMRIDIRPGDIIKSGGLRPHYVLFYNTDYEFTESWRHCMYGRYTELESLEELIQLVIKED